MQAVVFPSSGHRAPSIFAILPPTPVTSTIFGKEIADGASLLSFQRGPSQLTQLPRLTIKCEASRKGQPRRRVTSDDSSKDVKDETKDGLPSGGEKSKASSQKEIIDLFRRIHSSISNGPVPRKRNSRTTGVRNPNARNSNEKQTVKSQVSSKNTSRKKKEADDGLVNMEDVRPTRPTSNFIKRSPIPSPPPKKEDSKETISEVEKIDEKKAVEVNPEAEDKDSEMQKIDDMKLAELKELARAKGVKGYSKMKKGVLLELLKGVLLSS